MIIPIVILIRNEYKHYYNYVYNKIVLKIFLKIIKLAVGEKEFFRLWIHRRFFLIFEIHKILILFL